MDIQWKYLLCFIFADTAFLLGTADFIFCSADGYVWINIHSILIKIKTKRENILEVLVRALQSTRWYRTKLIYISHCFVFCSSPSQHHIERGFVHIYILNSFYRSECNNIRALNTNCIVHLTSVATSVVTTSIILRKHIALSEYYVSRWNFLYKILFLIRKCDVQCMLNYVVQEWIHGAHNTLPQPHQTQKKNSVF